MGTDGTRKEAARRKAAGKAKYSGAASQAPRGRAKETQEQKPGSRTVTLTTKNKPLSGGNSAGGAYIVKIAQDPRKTQKNPMGEFQTMPTSFRTIPSENHPFFPIQEPRKIYEKGGFL